MEGFAWATDNIGIKLGLMHGVFDCFQSKVDVIIKVNLEPCCLPRLLSQWNIGDNFDTFRVNMACHEHC